MRTAPVDALVLTIPGRQAFLARALTSVYAQTRQVAACVVVWDNLELTAPRNYKMAHGRNRALAACRSEYIAMLDDDNTWDPGYIAACEEHMGRADVIYVRSHPLEGYVDVDVALHAWDVNSIERGQLIELQKTSNIIDTNCIIRRSLLESIGGWEEDWSTGFAPNGCRSEDHDLGLRLMEAGASYAWVDVPLWTYQVHPTQSSRLRHERDVALGSWGAKANR